MTGIAPAPRPLVPAFLLRGFTSSAGELMAERRDRTRRRLVALGDVVAELGAYDAPAGRPASRELMRVLAEAEAGAEAGVAAMLAGRFPPAPSERASLALVLAVQLLLGRQHRVLARRAAKLVGQLITATIEETEAARAEAEGAGEPSSAAEPAGEAREGPEPAGEAPERPEPSEPEAAGAPDPTPHRAAEPALALSVLVRGRTSRPRALGAALPVARQIAGRIWQLVRFRERILLTSDTPVVLWGPSATAKPYQVGLGAADELRVPLDPRHALIVARRARAGEVVRDLTERHARALNRTVAESAAEWMYYHPESDPLEGVELASSDPA
jgi:hypothetical protein